MAGSVPAWVTDCVSGTVRASSQPGVTGMTDETNYLNTHQAAGGQRRSAGRGVGRSLDASVIVEDHRLDPGEAACRGGKRIGTPNR